MDEEYNAVITKDEWKIGEGDGEITIPVLKKAPTEDGEVFVMNFVVDAFVDLRRYMYTAAQMNQIQTEDTKFIPLEPKRGWTSFSNKYRKYMEILYEGFGNIFLTQSRRASQLKDFKSFMKSFSDYLDTIIPNFPITATGNVLSKRYSLDTTGLIIELLDSNHGNDVIKFEEFIQDPNFLFFVGAASQFGFRVDKNAPWRLIADIKSGKMQEYMNKYPQEPIDPGDPVAPTTPCELSQELFGEYIGHKTQFTSPDLVTVVSGTTPSCLTGKIRDVVCDLNAPQDGYFEIQTYAPGSDADLLDTLAGQGASDFDMSWVDHSFQEAVMDGVTNLPSEVAGWNGTVPWFRYEQSTSSPNHAPDLTVIGMAEELYEHHEEWRVNWINSSLSNFTAQATTASLMLHSAWDNNHPSRGHSTVDTSRETLSEALYGWENGRDGLWGVLPISISETTSGTSRIDEYRWTIEFSPDWGALNRSRAFRRVPHQATHTAAKRADEFPVDMVIIETGGDPFTLEPMGRMGLGEFYSEKRGGYYPALRIKHETAGTYKIKVEAWNKTDPVNPIKLVTKFLTLRTAIFTPDYGAGATADLLGLRFRRNRYRQSWKSLSATMSMWNIQPQGDHYKISSNNWREHVVTTTQIGYNPITVGQFQAMLTARLRTLWQAYGTAIRQLPSQTTAAAFPAIVLSHATQVVMTGQRLAVNAGNLVDNTLWDSMNLHNQHYQQLNDHHRGVLELTVTQNWLYYLIRFLRMNRYGILNPATRLPAGGQWIQPRSPWDPVSCPDVFQSDENLFDSGANTRLCPEPFHAHRGTGCGHCYFAGPAWEDLFYHHYTLPVNTDNFDRSGMPIGTDPRGGYYTPQRWGFQLQYGHARGDSDAIYGGLVGAGSTWTQVQASDAPQDLWRTPSDPTPPPIDLREYVQDHILAIQLLSQVVTNGRPLQQYIALPGYSAAGRGIKSKEATSINTQTGRYFPRLAQGVPELSGIDINRYFSAWATTPAPWPRGETHVHGNRRGWTVEEFIDVHGPRNYEESGDRGSSPGRSKPYTWEDADWAYARFERISGIVHVDPPVFPEFIGTPRYQSTTAMEDIDSDQLYSWLIQGARSLTWNAHTAVSVAGGRGWDTIAMTRQQISDWVVDYEIPGGYHRTYAPANFWSSVWPPTSLGASSQVKTKTRDLYQALVKWVNRDIVVINPPVPDPGTTSTPCRSDTYQPKIPVGTNPDLAFVFLEKDNIDFYKRRTRFSEELIKYLPLKEKYDLHVEAKRIYEEQMDQWRDIHDPNILAYGGPLSWNNLFIRQFEHTIDIDIPLLKEYMQDFYNSYALNQPVGLVATVKKNGLGVRKCIFNRPLIKKEDMDRLYPDTWWADFYYKVRVKESRKKITPQQLKHFKTTIANILSDVSGNNSVTPTEKTERWKMVLNIINESTKGVLKENTS